MTERTENLIARLYGLAEFEWCEHHVSAPDEDIVIVKGENEEWCSDQWTMLKSDYEIIKTCADALDKYFDKNIVTFVLPLEGKNKKEIETYEKDPNSKDQIVLTWPFPS